MNHCLFKAKDTKGAVGNTVDYSSLTAKLCSVVLHNPLNSLYGTVLTEHKYSLCPVIADIMYLPNKRR